MSLFDDNRFEIKTICRLFTDCWVVNNNCFKTICRMFTDCWVVNNNCFKTICRMFTDCWIVNNSFCNVKLLRIQVDTWYLWLFININCYLSKDHLKIGQKLLQYCFNHEGSPFIRNHFS